MKNDNKVANSKLYDIVSSIFISDIDKLTKVKDLAKSNELNFNITAREASSLYTENTSVLQKVVITNSTSQDRNSKTNLIKFLLKSGSNPNIENNFKVSPIYSASRSSNPYENSKILINYGADLNKESNQKLLNEITTYSGYQKLVKLFMENGINIREEQKNTLCVKNINREFGSQENLIKNNIIEKFQKYRITEGETRELQSTLNTLNLNQLKHTITTINKLKIPLSKVKNVCFFSDVKKIGIPKDVDKKINSFVYPSSDNKIVKKFIANAMSTNKITKIASKDAMEI